MKIDLEQFKDCDHCFHTFGSLGCCDTVNNEWVYSCREGQRKYLIDRVLEIIDKADEEYELWALKFQKVRDAVLALKGEHG